MTLSADVTNLYTAGRTFLPQAAEKYGEGAQEIHKTGQLDESAFRRDKVTNADGTRKPHWTDDPRNGGKDQFTTVSDLGRMQPQWSELRNMLQDQVLVVTRNSLVRAGSALCQIAEHYAATDGEARDALEKVRANLNTTSDPTYRPPSYIPEAPRHDDPHPEPDNGNDNPRGPR
ncbi:hypothetical protein [Stackebrandtia nassauensis]|uniref:ESX-1 secretion-associated protein EspA/EspE-like domain-containing protein n=1 Tax=Stackebrandtia nassauensis (strain DSM 44728 / CIP 108903 / NRRL B-16338 / NBRC 102104 / LLR-40K-21) TaxID=446470 RepID=D3Q9K7_STANL|nr:hypothetical protein [Stackebrandtia nassauensis]ADD44553.1 hypothetical protein Snas_4912 [Stackebrandtia nassauensis DSM 44728]